MKIVKNGYEYKVDNLQYTFRNIGVTDITYRLTNVTTGVIITSEYVVVPDGRTVVMQITSDAYYQLDIETVNGGEEVIEIMHFPETKEGILDAVKELLCDCSGDEYKGCGSNVNNNLEDLNKLQYINVSMGQYFISLLPISFTKPYICILRDTMQKDLRIKNLMDSTLTALDNTGKYKNNELLLKLNTVYLYTMLYIIEKDYEAYEDIDGTISIPIVDDSDVDSMFSISTMTECFNNINFDFESVKVYMKNLYDSGSYGLCIINSDPNPNPDDIVIDNFTHNGESVLLIGDPTTITNFSWNVLSGIPEHLKINDTENQLINLEVSGNSAQISPENYVLNQAGTIIWELSGSNVGNSTIRTDWVDPIYTGTTDVKTYPTVPEIKNGTIITEKLVDHILWDLNVSDTIAWIAIPTAAVKIFTKWEDVNEILNKGDIGLGDDPTTFIVMASYGVLIDNVGYYIYKFSWKSAINSTLKLY